MAVMTKSPAGDDIVILSRVEYEKLTQARQDAADAAVAKAITARISAGLEEMLTAKEVDALLAAPTPLAFWRRKRGLTQAGLAKRVGIAQGFVSELESGRKTGDVEVLRRISRALGVTMDDLAAQGTRRKTKRKRPPFSARSGAG